MRRLRSLLWMLFLGLSIFILGCIPGKQTDRSLLPLQSAELAPLVASIADRNKVTLVNVWATWCLPCVEEFPELVRLQKAYPDDVEVVFLSVDMPEQEGKVRVFLEKHGVDWPAYIRTGNDDETFISAVSKDWKGAIPFTTIYDQTGERFVEWAGKANYARFESQVLAALERTKK